METAFDIKATKVCAFRLNKDLDRLLEKKAHSMLMNKTQLLTQILRTYFLEDNKEIVSIE